MGNPAYEARREAERAEALRDLAAAEASKEAIEAIKDWMRGKASLSIMPPASGCNGIPWSIRFVRDVK